MSRVWKRKRDRVTGENPLVVIALAFISVNGTAPRRPAAGFAATARSAARISRVEELVPGLTVLSRPPPQCSHQSSLSTQNLPYKSSTHQKISKSAPTTTVTSHSHIHHFHHFQPQQQRLDSATSSSFITFSALNCDHVGAHLPSHANVDAMQAKQWFSPLVADQQKVASKFHPFRHSVRSSERALATCCFVA